MEKRVTSQNKIRPKSTKIRSISNIKSKFNNEDMVKI